MGNDIVSFDQSQPPDQQDIKNSIRAWDMVEEAAYFMLTCMAAGKDHKTYFPDLPEVYQQQILLGATTAMLTAGVNFMHERRAEILKTRLETGTNA